MNSERVRVIRGEPSDLASSFIEQWRERYLSETQIVGKLKAGDL